MGRDAHYRQKSPGPESKFTPALRRVVVQLALARPKDHGWPGPTSWSLGLLRESLVEEGVLESSIRERVRQFLIEESVTFPSVKTGKSSKDPKFAEKARRHEDLTTRQHNPPILVSVDEMGPMPLQPYEPLTWLARDNRTECPLRASDSEEYGTGRGGPDRYQKRLRG